MALAVVTLSLIDSAFYVNLLVRVTMGYCMCLCLQIHVWTMGLDQDSYTQPICSIAILDSHPRQPPYNSKESGLIGSKESQQILFQGFSSPTQFICSIAILDSHPRQPSYNSKEPQQVLFQGFSSPTQFICSIAIPDSHSRQPSYSSKTAEMERRCLIYYRYLLRPVSTSERGSVCSLQARFPYSVSS